MREGIRTSLGTRTDHVLQIYPARFVDGVAVEGRFGDVDAEPVCFWGGDFSAVMEAEGVVGNVVVEEEAAEGTFDEADTGADFEEGGAGGGQEAGFPDQAAELDV